MINTVVPKNKKQNRAYVHNLISVQTQVCSIYCIELNTRDVKKRPNFLNSAPRSTQSALRSLSAPSVMFWQQTVICPVSLWALVVELHPLNWASAQTVCRISDKVTMKNLEERRGCVWKFAANLVKILQRHFSCLTKHAGRTGERVCCTKKSTDESVEDQGDAVCVFWLERHCPSWNCTMW
jgi:hypothetical protein